MASREKHFLRFIPRNGILYPLVKFCMIPLLALAVLVLLTDFLVMPFVTRHGQEFQIPNIVGVSLTEATDMLAEVGAVVEIAGEEPSPDLPEGTVMVQTPFAGSMAKKGRRVKVIISAGREMVEVPGIVGFSQRQSELKLREAGLKVGTFNWASNDSLPVNVLVFSVPSAGSLVLRDTPINLFFNRGSQGNVVFVPQFVGMLLDEAEQIADSLGLLISKVDYATNAFLLPNTVLWQSQRAGSKTETGSYIQLKVSVTD